MRKILILFLSVILLSSCESEEERKTRLAQEEREQIELEQQRIERARADSIRLEKIRLEEEAQAEIERKEQEIYNRYISNSLNTGATPYSKYYGRNPSCVDYGCSQIRVRTSNSDVVVLIKKNDNVIRHAFIQANDSYTFSFPNGKYQTFFYYGKGWNPNKIMKDGEILGGFVANESFGKDEPLHLSNNALEYELILQTNGNFSTKPSNPEEAL